MKSTPSRFTLTALAYIIPTMILGMAWHFVFFKELYDSLGIYTRTEPIISLGFSSMIIQGLILAYFYPYYSQEKGNSMRTAVIYSLLMGLFLFSISTLANAAKIEVTSMQNWLFVQSAFHLVQFTVAGLLIGIVNRK